MNLEYYLQQLLFNFDCVIIPNFGGIVAQPIGAAIHTTQHVFYAPKKQLAFNKNLDKTDGLLVNHVALNQNISYQEATDWVELQVQNWKEELKQNNKLSVAEVGRFFVDKESNILFEPASFVNYSFDAFGCASFQATPVSNDKLKAKQKVQPKFVEPTKAKQTRKINFKKLLPFAVALPLLAIGVYIPVQTNLLKGFNASFSSLNPFSFSTQTIAKYSERIPVALPNLQLLAIDVDITNNEIANQRNTTSEPIVASTSVVAIKSNNKFHLIVGAFATQENANQLISELNQKGFHAYVQGTSGSGLIRVSCNGFSNKTEATSAKATAKEQGVDAWLLQE